MGRSDLWAALCIWAQPKADLLPPTQVCLSALALCLAATAAPACDFDQMAGFLSSGTWGWSNDPEACELRPQSFRFNGRGSYLWSRPDVSAEYIILDHSPNSMTAQIVGEDRMTPQGTPVVWELRFGGPDAFCLHATHWPVLACTDFIIRCPEPRGMS